MIIWVEKYIYWANLISLSDLSNVATLIGIPIALIGLFYTAYQIHLNTKISHGQFWLELEKMFSTHDEIHIKLRPGGEWTKENSGPQNIQEWAKVEDYLGLFEHCELMLQNRLIDWKTFKLIFSYRLSNIIANKTIVKKINLERESWVGFFRLLKQLNIEIID